MDSKVLATVAELHTTHAMQVAQGYPYMVVSLATDGKLEYAPYLTLDRAEEVLTVLGRHGYHGLDIVGSPHYYDHDNGYRLFDYPQVSTR